MEMTNSKSGSEGKKEEKNVILWAMSLFPPTLSPFTFSHSYARFAAFFFSKKGYFAIRSRAGKSFEY